MTVVTYYHPLIFSLLKTDIVLVVLSPVAVSLLNDVKLNVTYDIRLQNDTIIFLPQKYIFFLYIKFWMVFDTVDVALNKTSEVVFSLRKKNTNYIFQLIYETPPMFSPDIHWFRLLYVRWHFYAIYECFTWMMMTFTNTTTRHQDIRFVKGRGKKGGVRASKGTWNVCEWPKKGTFVKTPLCEKIFNASW